MKKLRCGECGGINVKPKSINGKSFPYKHHQQVTVSTNLELYTCQDCQNVLLTTGDCKKLDKAIEETLAQKIEDPKGSVKIQLNTCKECKDKMVNISSKEVGVSGYYSALQKLFPRYCEEDLKAQIRKNGWKYKSCLQSKGSYICEDCAKEGKASFECDMCAKEKSVDRLEESYGDTSDGGGSFLCKDCFETASAKAWEVKENELYSKHRYDFE